MFFLAGEPFQPWTRLETKKSKDGRRPDGRLEGFNTTIGKTTMYHLDDVPFGSFWDGLFSGGTYYFQGAYLLSKLVFFLVGMLVYEKLN